MKEDVQVNFGWFVRQARTGKFTLGEFSDALDVTPRRMSQIESSMPEPAIYPDTMSRIAAKLGYANVGEFEKCWRSTPVARPKFKEAPKGETVLLRVRVPKSVAEELRDAGRPEVVAASILMETVNSRHSAPAPAESEAPRSSGPLTVLHVENESTRAEAIDPGEVIVEERIDNRPTPTKRQTKKHRREGSTN